MPHIAIMPGPKKSGDQFYEQNSNAINNGGKENAFDGFVFSGVYVKSKQHGIGNQGYTADQGKHGLVFAQVIEVFDKTNAMAEKSHKIVDNGSQDGCQES